jgi:hypothetical protein
MDDATRSVFQNRMRSGDLVLFTGAGFSSEARSITGDPLPVGSALREVIWRHAYPGEPFEEESTLGDLYQLAVRRAQNRLGEELRRALTVNPNTLPDFYRLWFAVPWRTIYTLNVDDLENAAERHFELPVPMTSISALGGDSLAMTSRLMSVHLNGKIADYPNMTFSDTQYGERTALPDPWYRHMAADLSARSVVFVGTVLDEPPLWQQVAVRRMRDRRRPELRHRSFLVTPRLSRSRQDVLGQLNIDWVPMTARQFAEDVLGTMQPFVEEGHRYLSQLRSSRSPTPSLLPVSELQAEERGDLAEYVLGRQPSWADITKGYAVCRAFEQGLDKQVLTDMPNAVIVTGTAGTGKTSTILRLAIGLQVAGKDVQYLDTEGGVAIQRLRSTIRQNTPDVLVIDDVDIFGTAAGLLLADLTGDSPHLVVVAGVRSTHVDDLDIESNLSGRTSMVVDVPPLCDADIEALVSTLTRARRLGTLMGLPYEQQCEMLRRKSGRQLLVAMIEATSDKRFEDRVHDECSQLPSTEQFVYAIVALATRFRQFLRKDEILIAAGTERADVLQDINALVRKQILIVGQRGDLSVRHRVIADEAGRYFRQVGMHSLAIEGLLFALATKTGGDDAWQQSRERRLMIKLLSHDFLLQEVMNAQRVREIYAGLEDVLAWDFHFWLQRGAFEVDVSNIDGAEIFLTQALALASDDYRVQTEWAHMQLKKACQLAEQGDSTGKKVAGEAFADLHDVIWRRGKRDSYPYHVLGSQGLAWSRRAPMSGEDRASLLRELLETVREGRKNHPRHSDLQVLDFDLYAEYLKCANP